MSDEIFRQTRKKITPEELGAGDDRPVDNPMDAVRSIQDAVNRETGSNPIPANSPREASPFSISGNLPPEFKRALEAKSMKEIAANPVEAPVASHASEEIPESFATPPERPRRPTPDSQVRVQGSDALENLLGRLAEKHTWEEFEFPSRGKFYTNIPSVIHVRAMTGEEEQILATPRLVKKGKAIDMIFKKCIREPINTEDLLSSDRTNLLIFLRGISYTPEYDVEIKCPNCSIRFAHVIDLNEMEVDVCPDDFGPDKLEGRLPESGFYYRYRLATGEDEKEITNYKEKIISQWGDQGNDDTILYRTALLLEEIEGVTFKKELSLLLKKLPIQDVAHLRNEINSPPFGVDTELPILCPSCTEEFKIDLPLETSFFFPRKRTKETQA